MSQAGEDDDDESVSIGHTDPSFRPRAGILLLIPSLRSDWRATMPPLMFATLRREYWNDQPTRLGELFILRKERSVQGD